MNVFPYIGIRDCVCISLSGDNLKLAYAKISPTHKELVDLVSYKIQGLSDEEITKSIYSTITSLKLIAPDVTIVVPSHATIAKNIEIPSLDAQEIKEIVDLQAGRHTPYSREEIIIDYINIGAYRENYTKILLIIIAVSVIRRQVEIVEKANLRVEKIYFSPEMIASFNSSVLKSGKEGFVQTILHVDANFTDFMNVSNGKIIFIRSIPIGHQHLFNEQDRFQIRFVEEVKKSLETYQSEDIGPLPEEIILTGSVQKDDKLQELLSQMLFIPVSAFPYLKHSPLASQELKKSLMAGQDSFLDVIAPLIHPGREQINLIPEEIRLRKRFEEKSKDLVSTGVHVIMILAMLCFYLISSIIFKSSYLKKLNDKYAPVIEVSQRLNKDFSQIRLIKRELKNRNVPINVLVALYDLIPNDIQLSGINFTSGGKFSIEGNSRTMGTVFALIGEMEESEIFMEVESKRTTKRRDGDQEVVDFEITCSLEEGTGLKS